MNKFLLLLLSLVMLASCSGGRSALLVSEDGAEAWIGSGKRVTVVTAGGGMLEQLETLSGEDAADALHELLGFGEDDPAFRISGEACSERMELLSLLSDVTGSSSPYEARVRYDEDIWESEFFSNLSGLSSSFDDILSEDIIRKRDMDFREYELERILPSPSDWNEALDFMSVWMNAVKVRK